MRTSCWLHWQYDMPTCTYPARTLDFWAAVFFLCTTTTAMTTTKVRSRNMTMRAPPTEPPIIEVEVVVSFDGVGEQITPASLLWLWQLWSPTPLWVQSARFVSFPLQPTSSKKIGSTPGPKMPLSTLTATASAKSMGRSNRSSAQTSSLVQFDLMS